MNSYLVVVRVDLPREHEKDLDSFYLEEHFTAMLSVAGVKGARRFRLVQGDGPQHMVFWEIERPEVTESEPYKKAAFTPRREKVVAHYTTRLRSVYEEIIGFRKAQYDEMKSRYIWVARMDVPPEIEDEFNEWYLKEHIPLLLLTPGWNAVRRFRRIQGDGQKYMTIWEIESPSVLQGEERERPLKTESAQRIRPQFRNHSRSLYEQIYGLLRY